MYALIDHNSLTSDIDVSIDQILLRLENFIILIHKLAKVRGYTSFLRASNLEVAQICPQYSFKAVIKRMFEERRQGEGFDRMTLFQTILNSGEKWDEILRKKYNGFICLDSDGQDCSQTIYACAAFSEGVVISWRAQPVEASQEKELWVAYNDNDDPHQVIVECVVIENQIGRFYRLGRHRHGENAFTDAELRRHSDRSRCSDIDLDNYDAQYVLNLGVVDDQRIGRNNRLIKAIYKDQIYCFYYDQTEDRKKVIFGYSNISHNFYEFRFDNSGGYHGYIVRPYWGSRQKENLIQQIINNRQPCGS